MAALAAACGGVQVGDAGDDDDGEGHCVSVAVAIANFDTVPEGFARTPREMLAPAFEPIVGTLEGPDGGSTPVRFEIEFDEESATGSLFQPTDADSPCGGPVLNVSASVTVEGAPVLSGKTTAVVYAENDAEIRVQLDAAGLDADPPTFEQEPGAAPKLLVAVVMKWDSVVMTWDCEWYGRWGWTAEWVCDQPDPGTCYERVYVGDFRGPGACP